MMQVRELSDKVGKYQHEMAEAQMKADSEKRKLEEEYTSTVAKRDAQIIQLQLSMQRGKISH